jgi:hypothetical protein
MFYEGRITCPYVSKPWPYSTAIRQRAADDQPHCYGNC